VMGWKRGRQLGGTGVKIQKTGRTKSAAQLTSKLTHGPERKKSQPKAEKQRR